VSVSTQFHLNDRRRSRPIGLAIPVVNFLSLTSGNYEPIGRKEKEEKEKNNNNNICRAPSIDALG